MNAQLWTSTRKAPGQLPGQGHRSVPHDVWAVSVTSTKGAQPSGQTYQRRYVPCTFITLTPPAEPPQRPTPTANLTYSLPGRGAARAGTSVR
jgi:hypothetical protein